MALVRSRWNQDRSTCLFTIGYEGRSIDAYLDALIANNVRALVDVRGNPRSMKYGFSSPRFDAYVQKAGLTYYHEPDLGIPAELRRKLEYPDDYQRLFSYYDTQILPHQEEALERVRDAITTHGRVALTCFERSHERCHRHRIALRLAAESAGPEVAHL